MRKRSSAALAAVAAAALPLCAAAQQGCSQETLDVRGTQVRIGYCISAAPRSNPGGELVVPVAASYAAPGGSFSQAEELHFIAGEGASRVVEDLALSRLGLAGQTLHLTLVYNGGVVRVEGALLTPGAVTIK